MKPPGIALGGASLLVAACAPKSLTTEQMILLRKAIECQRAHAEIEHFAVDRSGQVTVRYRDGPGALVDPPEDCGF